MFEYKVDHVVRVIDGDTLIVVLDLGFTVKLQQTVRLLGIDCPERFSNAGRESSRAIIDIISDQELVMKSHKSGEDSRGSFGRYLAEVYIRGNPTSVNQMLVDQGFATYRKGDR